MRFLIDEQLPPALADHLVSAGHKAEHVRELGLGGATDARIWRRVRLSAAVLVTKDEDFVAMAKLSATRAPVIWVRVGNTTNRALWAALKPLLPEIVAAIEAGEDVVEVR